MGKSTISMAIFKSYFDITRPGIKQGHPPGPSEAQCAPSMQFCTSPQMELWCGGTLLGSGPVPPVADSVLWQWCHWRNPAEKRISAWGSWGYDGIWFNRNGDFINTYGHLNPTRYMFLSQVSFFFLGLSESQTECNGIQCFDTDVGEHMWTPIFIDKKCILVRWTFYV